MGSSHAAGDQSPGAGLCDACAHQRVVVSGRGSRFSMCLAAKRDPSLEKYPRLPVLACAAYEPLGSEPRDEPSPDGSSSSS